MSLKNENSQSNTTIGMKPLLKWVGGKTQILEKLFTHFPISIHNYYEPFLGGGSVLIELLERRRKNAMTVLGEIFASDKNPVIIHFFQHVQTCPEELWDAVLLLKERYEGCDELQNEKKKRTKLVVTEETATLSKEHFYYYCRDLFNKEPYGTLQKSAYFLFLNKTCFRGVYREGPNGFNVPFGNNKNPEIISREHLMKISELIQGVHFESKDVVELQEEKYHSDDFIYLDPPYVPEDEKKSFENYTSDGFAKEKTQLLFDWCKSLKERNIKFLMSNSFTHPIKEAFNNDERFTIEQIKCKRTIHSKNPSSTTIEIFIY